MKKFIVLLLATLLIVGLCVSCKDSPKPVASEEIVEYVVNNTMFYFELFYDPVVALTVRDEQSDYVANCFKDYLEDLFSAATTIDVEADSESLSVDITGDIFNLSIRVFNLSYSTETDKISGKFSCSSTQRESGTTESMDAKGSFEIGETDYSIVYSDVTFNGVAYDVVAFNEAIKEGEPTIA